MKDVGVQRTPMNQSDASPIGFKTATLNEEARRMSAFDEYKNIKMLQWDQ